MSGSLLLTEWRGYSAIVGYDLAYLSNVCVHRIIAV